MFITFEGPEGSGKSSQITALSEYLCGQGYAVLTTREPGGTSISEQIRAVINNLDNTEMLPRTEILLFQAARAQLVEEKIRPHLVQGGIVLCDRYADSTLAYQGYGHATDLKMLAFLIDYATGGLKPDLTLLLDVDVEEGLKRRSRGGEWNRLDAYQLAFHQRVRQGYLELAHSEPQRWRIIDASQTPAQVQAAVRQIVMQKIHAQAVD